MKVTLLNKIDLTSAIVGAGVCVGKSPNEASIKGLISAVEQGHLSVLEHAWLDFHIEDVSIALSRQLLRHRLMSPHERSLRYCVINDTEEWFVKPNSIEAEAEAEFMMAMLECYRVYESLLKLGVKAEDARYVLPLATKTKLAISMNLRTFIEIAQKRLCMTAQEEIRKLFDLMCTRVFNAINNACDEEVYGVDENRRFYFAIADLVKPDCANCKEKRGCKR